MNWKYWNEIVTFWYLRYRYLRYLPYRYYFFKLYFITIFITGERSGSQHGNTNNTQVRSSYYPILFRRVLCSFITTDFDVEVLITGRGHLLKISLKSGRQACKRTGTRDLIWLKVV